MWRVARLQRRLLRDSTSFGAVEGVFGSQTSGFRQARRPWSSSDVNVVTRKWSAERSCHNTELRDASPQADSSRRDRKGRLKRL